MLLVSGFAPFALLTFTVLPLYRLVINDLCLMARGCSVIVALRSCQVKFVEVCLCLEVEVS
jgi:hypothetical protein